MLLLRQDETYEGQGNKQAMHIRQAVQEDIPLLEDIAKAQGDSNEAAYFEKSLAEQAAGNRMIFIAEQGGRVAGYVQLNWKPTYVPFRRLDIPEIQDLNVVPAARRQGVGAALVEACEKTAREKGRTDIGIAVGLYPRYGAAQRLYVRRGYVPDGAGIAYDDIPVQAGEMRAVDDLLTLKLIRSL